MTKISSRQLYFFLAMVAPVGKLILFPSQLVYYAGNDLLFPAIANFLLQGIVIFLIMLLARSNQTLYQLLENTFGKIAAKIIICLYALFLLYAGLLPLLEQKLFVQSVFYDTLPSLIAFAPFFLFSAYLCAKPLSSLGRVWSILGPLALGGFIGILCLSVPNADWNALMPVGAQGAKGFLGGTAYTMNWFFDSALVLLFMGRFEYKKGMAWKSLVAYLLGAAAIVFFLAVFYGIFSDIAARQIFTFTKISKYFSAITVLGRIDYIFIYSLALVMAFYCSLPLHAGVECLREAFKGNKIFSIICSVAINFIFLMLAIMLDYKYYTVDTTISQAVFWIFPVFTVLVPLLALLLRRRRREQV